MVFIDTPLDIALARRVLRDFSLISSDTSSSAIDCLKARLTAYLRYGRQAYLEMNQQVKPNCDLILDGCSSVDDLASEIATIIKAKTA